jgi:hypothetical protein
MVSAEEEGTNTAPELVEQRFESPNHQRMNFMNRGHSKELGELIYIVGRPLTKLVKFAERSRGPVFQLTRRTDETLHQLTNERMP